MLMPASSEFVSLCRSQVILVTEGLGASLSAVYLTEEIEDDTDAKLIPIVVYPEEAVPWSEAIPLRLPVNGSETQSYLPLAGSPTTFGNVSPTREQLEGTLVAEDGTNLFQAATPTSDASNPAKAEVPLSLLGQQRVVLPLIHEGIVLGLLVTSREDRQWYEWEQAQLEQVARTLAIACVLDQRYQWLEHSAYDQGLTRAQQQDTFKNLLHQFRNPLTALRTFGKLLLKRLNPGDANREVANSIVRESDRLQALLQQFDAATDLGQAELDFDRAPSPLHSRRPLPLTSDWSVTSEEIQPGVTLPTQPLLPPSGLTIGTHLPLEPCFVAQILEPLLISAKAIAQERQLNLQADIPTDLPPVQANNLALQEVFSNLMDNALKYTPKRGQVLVQVSQSHSQAGNYQVITVSDTGPGIPPEDLNHVFERHYRGVQAQTDIPGTGLGLAIAHELVEQMQGKIQALSPAIEKGAHQQAFWGPGSTFVVWLPEVRLND